MSRSVAFHTLGCKLNFAETSTIAKDFDTAGFITVPYKEKADVYVINTCSVTENADRECRNIVGRALKANPDGFIVVVGCYAQLKPEQIMEMPGVDLVLGATHIKFTSACSTIPNFSCTLLITEWAKASTSAPVALA